MTAAELNKDWLLRESRMRIPSKLAIITMTNLNLKKIKQA